MSTMPSEPAGDAGSWPNARPEESGSFSLWSDSEAFRSATNGVGLISMVESEIIPRLMLAHRTAAVGALPAIDAKRSLGPDTTEAFARMVVTREPDSLIAFVGDLLRSGVSLDTIYTELLVPAARRLGDYWDEDSASFTDVTIGLGRLQQVVRALGRETPGHHDTGRLNRSAFFVPGPGEQHMFGVFLVEDFFRRAGWRTWVETTATPGEIVDTVRGHWFDVFGLSVSIDTHIDDLGTLIQAAREASRNPGLFVMVGGRLFLDHPELVTAVGADATASSGGEALLVANHALLLADDRVSALTPGA